MVATVPHYVQIPPHGNPRAHAGYVIRENVLFYNGNALGHVLAVNHDASRKRWEIDYAPPR